MFQSLYGLSLIFIGVGVLLAIPPTFVGLIRVVLNYAVSFVHLINDYLVKFNSYWFSHQWDIRQSVLRLCVSTPSPRPSLLKSRVFTGEFAVQNAAVDHTHGKSAANRTGAVAWISRAIKRLGRQAVFVQARASDVRNQRVHSTVWYWVNDLGVEQRTPSVSASDVIVMVDVDYYANMNNWLSYFPDNIFALYTLTPTEAGVNTQEYSFCFTRDNLLRMHVAGGANFEHELYNYSTDELRASGGWFSSTSYRLVERRFVGCDHSVVWLFPAGRVRFGFDWILRLLGWQLDATPLVRFKPANGEFIRFVVNDSRGCQITTCRAESYDACTVEAAVDSRVRASAHATTVTLTNHTVESYGVPKDAAIFLTDFWRACEDIRPPLMAIGPSPVTNYECGPRFNEEAKPSVAPFMDPLITGGAFAPYVSEGNMGAAIQKRLIDITSDVEPSQFVEDAISEFISELMAETGITRHSLSPTDLEEVRAKQTSRAQREQFEAFGVGLGGRSQDASAFMKREVYPEIKDPRIITNMKPSEKFNYSTYIYTVTRVLKQCHWYSFVEPAALERKMSKFFGQRVLAETDFSRMDGRYSKVLRLLECSFALAIFKLEYHEAFLTAFSEDHHKRIYAAFELIYLSEWHRLSGSAATSAFNTLGSAFVEYLAKRLKYAPGGAKRGYTSQRQFSPSEAYASLGMYGGDDGALAVPPNFDLGRFDHAASLVGQKIEITQVVGPLSFLGRYFGELSAGSTNSCADIRRQLVKFHLSTDRQTEPLQKFIEKAYAFHILDSQTPLLGSLGRKALRLLGKESFKPSDHLDGTLSWNARLVILNGEKPFTNYAADWMWEKVVETLDGFDIKAFNAWCLLDTLSVSKPFLVLDVPYVQHDASVHEPMVSSVQIAEQRMKKKRTTKPDLRPRTEVPKEKEELVEDPPAMVEVREKPQPVQPPPSGPESGYFIYGRKPADYDPFSAPRSPQYQAQVNSDKLQDYARSKRKALKRAQKRAGAAGAGKGGGNGRPG
jgi:hypothetical protein